MELPTKIEYACNEFTIEKNIPIIYGNTSLDLVNKTESKTIYCGIDIVGSIFFMLTRWEEIVNTSRDKRDRFLAQESVAYKFNFLHRPIVNEYIEMLWNMLEYIGHKGGRKKRVFSLNPTHDIDHLSPFPLLTVVEETIAYKDYFLPIKRLIQNLKGINVYETFDFLMSESEKHNTVSTFYFMSNGSHFRDNRYKPTHKKIKKAISDVLSRGHKVGFHAGYETYLDKNELFKQKTNLEKAHKISIDSARQHYLRFKTPETWNNYEIVGLKHDSSLSHPDLPGFRCGTSDEFQVLDVIKRKIINVWEKPPVIMDSMLYRMNTTVEIQIKEIIKYRNICEKFKMPYTFIVHNSSFDPVKWKSWYEIYPYFFVS